MLNKTVLHADTLAPVLLGAKNKDKEKDKTSNTAKIHWIESKVLLELNTKES